MGVELPEFSLTPEDRALIFALAMCAISFGLLALDWWQAGKPAEPTADRESD